MRLLLLVVIALLSPSALAAPPEKSRFYDFGTQVIDGQRLRPAGTYHAGRPRAVFDRMLRLKKSFLPAMMATSRDPSLR